MTTFSDGKSRHITLRAALYLRVSTTRQAEHDVSIPDQRKQGEAWCAAPISASISSTSAVCRRN